MLDSDRVVISNTTPLISLSAIDHLSLLQRLYGTIFIPVAVRDELIAGRAKVHVDLEQVAWLQVVALKDQRRADTLVGLDRGEAEVLALAVERSADLVLLDERLGRRYARHLGLTLSGTLGVLIKAKERHFVPAIAPLIDLLQQRGIWLSETLIAPALKRAGEET